MSSLKHEGCLLRVSQYDNVCISREVFYLQIRLVMVELNWTQITRGTNIYQLQSPFCIWFKKKRLKYFFVPLSFTKNVFWSFILVLTCFRPLYIYTIENTKYYFTKCIILNKNTILEIFILFQDLGVYCLLIFWIVGTWIVYVFPNDSYVYI
jgi:hypothetical protein